MRILVALLLMAGALAGCLGGEARTEWAFEDTQLASGLRTGSGVTIAVLDTGVNVGHPSLRHLVDGEGHNGELVAFKDYLGGREGVEAAHDPDGHGSHVIGILAARGSRLGDKIVYGGVDLLGAAPDARFIAARVCDDASCRVDEVARAIRWAVERGADVLSLSLGGAEAFRDLDPILQDAIETAIEDALDAGVVVVAAAGNSQEDGADDVDSPADIPHVIAVGAIDEQHRMASFSNHGSSDRNRCTTPIPSPFSVAGRCDPHRKPELVAPGVDILSAWSGDAYVRASGTSQAVPFVTAAVAWMLQGEPPLTDRDDVVAVKNALRDSASPLAGQALPHDSASGYGLVQARDAVAAY